jgi:hypothetical protein
VHQLPGLAVDYGQRLYRTGQPLSGTVQRHRHFTDPGTLIRITGAVALEQMPAGYFAQGLDTAKLYGSKT